MPLLLSIYIATEILAPFFASFLILNAILFLGRVVPLLDSILGFGVSPADFLRLCAYLLPKLMLFSIPMASMMAVILAITRMAGDNEIMALKASGIGLGRLLPPVLVFSLTTALLAWFSAVVLVPQGTVAMRNLFLHLAMEKIDKGIQARQFSEGLENIVLYIDRIDPETRQWHGVYLADLGHGKMPLTIVAQTGSFGSRPNEMTVVLNLANGILNQASDDVTQTIHFERYRLSLPITAPAALLGAAPGDGGKNSLNQSQLLAQAAGHGPKSSKGLPLLIEYHTRMALPVGCLILSVLGLALAMLGKAGRRPPGVSLGLLFFVVYYVLFTAGKAAAEGGILPVVPGVWLPNILLGLFTLLLTRQVAAESPLLFDRIPALIENIAARLAGLRTRGGRR